MTYNIIYKITNTINGKVYIGQTTRKLWKRKSRHIQEAKTTDNHLYRSMRKYGIEHFEFQIIESKIHKDNLDERERYWIQHYDSFNNGYNCTIGGGGCQNFKMPESAKEKIRKARIGYKQSDEAKQKIGDYWRGKKHSKKHIENYRKAMIGKTMSEESKIKNRLASIYQYKIHFTDGTYRITEKNCSTNLSKELGMNRKTFYSLRKPDTRKRPYKNITWIERLI